jgi:hypothetical protein
MSTGTVFFGHKKRITERNSHLAGEVSESSISNGCHAKTERRRQPAGVGTGRGGTKLHASVAGSRVTAFLATAAPWEPYFTDNPRIYKSSRHHIRKDSNLHSMLCESHILQNLQVDKNTYCILIFELVSAVILGTTCVGCGTYFFHP